MELSGYPFGKAVDYTGKLSFDLKPNSLNDQIHAVRDVLSLYSLVRSDPTQTSGTWDTINFVSDRDAWEEEQIRNALFGDGTNSGSLISQVITGKAKGG